MTDLSDSLLLGTLQEINKTLVRVNENIVQHGEKIAVLDQSIRYLENERKTATDTIKHWQMIVATFVGAVVCGSGVVIWQHFFKW